MGKAKMFKIRGIDSLPNVFQNEHFSNPVLKNHEGKLVYLKGKWASEVFKNDNPIVLELACGKGDYTLALAQKYPNKNFIGIDSKGARIYTGATRAIVASLSNVAFARLKIENIVNFFAPGEVSEIWITFPDPFPKKGDAKRRLSSPSFLERYKQICKPGATIHFKTDDLPLFHFTKQTVHGTGRKCLYYREDIYSAPLELEELEIKTYYEKMHLEEGRTINYLSFQI